MMGFDQQNFSFLLFPLVFPFILFEVILKAVALWKAARNGQMYWFIAITIVNSAGLLPILYILFFQKKKKK